MTHRPSKRTGSRRSPPRARAGEPLEFLKPLVVLGLMGMILYGAYSVISRGPGREPVEPISPLQPTVTLDMPAPPGDPAGGATSAEPGAMTMVEGPSPPQVAVAVAGGAGGIPAEPADPSTAPAAPLASPTTPPRTAAGSSAPSGLEALSAAAVSTGAEASLPVDMPLPPAALRGQAAAPPLPGSPVPGSPGAPEPQRQTVASPFAAAWTEAHDKLAAGQYADALSILSAWQDDPGLADAETRRLDELLGQLAGSVIYSQESHLGPPHVVTPGETLLTIASPLQVPWQLLAKINGVENPSALVPGEALKVVEGPFDAILSLSRRRLSLQLRGRYAGSFPVSIGRQVEEKVGQSLAVERVNRGTTSDPNAPAELASGGPVVQAAFHSGGTGMQILLRDGVVIEAVADPADAPTGATSIVVSAPDLGELVDILVPGSHVFLRP
jgi:LysM repeat protein